MENNYFVDSDKLSASALEKKHRLENDPSFRTDHMKYMEGMERISSDIMDKVMSEMNSYDYNSYTYADVRAALSHDHCTVEDFKALLSPAAEPFLEKMAEKARLEALKEMMKYSLIIISSIPVLVIYPFVQKHFVKGVMIGAVKG